MLPLKKKRQRATLLPRGEEKKIKQLEKAHVPEIIYFLW